MAPLLRVEGTYPNPVTFTLGWLRAQARPWNEVVSDPMLRLERGGSEFLEDVSARLHELAPTVYSPALYPGSTRVWRRGGYRLHAELEVMERPLSATPAVVSTDFQVETAVDAGWDGVLTVDRAAFEGFWGMSRMGLEEAHATNRANVLLITPDTAGLAGYALVGAQWGVAYLHRIAVHPERTGRGVGSALLEAALAWGRSHGGRSMVLNVRSDNLAARRLYEKHGFSGTGIQLQVLRHDAA